MQTDLGPSTYEARVHTDLVASATEESRSTSTPLVFVPTIMRELLSWRRFPREPEPDLVMEDRAQVTAYSAAGRADSEMAAAYLFHTAYATQVLRGRRFVVDLACGPATQLAKIARLNPGTQFLGLDLSEAMLEDAERHVGALGLTNVRFERADITAIRGLATGSVDGVMSTMSLHHLPALADLRRCFAEAARILKPGGALYMVDFGRLKSLASVRFFAYRNTQSAPELFARDFELSLRAAFLPRDFRTLARELLPANVAVHAMFPGRLMVLLRTPPTRLDPDVARELNGLRLALPERYRAELDNMRLFFKFGGVRGDPFNT